MPQPLPVAFDAAVIGGGPSGLMAAETLLQAGLTVALFDRMPSVGRKFLLAGKGGLNLTHAEPLPAFVSRYGERAPQVALWLECFGPQALRAWAAGLGIETFVGSSARVFPRDLKAAPLLRAWLQRLRRSGLALHMRWAWRGWTADGALRLQSPEGEQCVRARATVLACGGASWPQLGSDGAWVPLLEQAGIAVAPLQPANCGFEIAGGWTEHLRTRFAGAPIKPVRLHFDDAGQAPFDRQGEFVLSDYGVEGSLIYAVAGRLRDALATTGRATLRLDLLPDVDVLRLQAELSRPRNGRSLSTVLKGRFGLAPPKLALLHEVLPREMLDDAARLAVSLKALPLELCAPRPISEAISCAGGVRLEALDPWLMLSDRPGFFCCGEMLDWEAPTGGYLLQACLASGRVAGRGAASWLRAHPEAMR